MRRVARALLLAVLTAAPTVAAEMRFILPPPAAPELHRNLVYAGTGEEALRFDLYLPVERSGAVPIVIFLNGIGADWMRGHVQYTGWGRAVTARGLAGITMDSRAEAVDGDLVALLDHLGKQAAELGDSRAARTAYGRAIDAGCNRSASGHVDSTDQKQTWGSLRCAEPRSSSPSSSPSPDRWSPSGPKPKAKAGRRSPRT